MAKQLTWGGNFILLLMHVQQVNNPLTSKALTNVVKKGLKRLFNAAFRAVLCQVYVFNKEIVLILLHAGGTEKHLQKRDEVPPCS